MEPYRHVRGFLQDDEVARFRGLVERHDDLYVEVQGKGGLGPRYRVIDGDRP